MAEELAQKSKRWETWRIAAEWISGIFVLLHVVVGVHDFWTEDRGRLWDLLRLNSISKFVHTMRSMCHFWRSRLSFGWLRSFPACGSECGDCFPQEALPAK